MATKKTTLTAAALAMLFSVLISSSEAGLPLPSMLKPCPKNDPKLNECAAANGNVAVPKLKNGIPSFGVPPLDPFFVNKIVVEGSTIGIHLDFTDVQIHGLANSKVKSIKISHDPPNFIWSLYTPMMQMVGKYEASGRVLILPIVGSGDFNFTMYGMDYVYEFSCDTVKKSDGEIYYAPRTNQIDYSVEKIHIFMDNLFNGNKLLGDEMNRFMNENWKELDQSVGPKIAESIATAMQSVTRAITSRVPIKNFWIEK